MFMRFMLHVVCSLLSLVHEAKVTFLIVSLKCLLSIRNIDISEKVYIFKGIKSEKCSFLVTS